MEISNSDQIFSALQSIEITATQLSTTLAPWEELTLERVTQLSGGLDIIERQLSAIQGYVDAVRAKSEAVRSCWS